MVKFTNYKSFETIVKSYLFLIKHNNNIYKQLKDILIVIYKQSYIKEDVKSLDIRSKKNKEKLLEISRSFINAPVISRLKLLDRGWSIDLIKEFLGEADLIQPNPQMKSAPFLQLYSLCRVEKWEESNTVKDSIKVRVASFKNKDKNINISDWVKELEINVPIIPIEVLLRESISVYNDKIVKKFEDSRSLYTKAHILEQLCLSYLRHECSNYERQLEDLNCVIACRDGYIRLKEHINKQISIIYPNLKNQIYQYQLNNNYIENSKPKILAKR